RVAPSGSRVADRGTRVADSRSAPAAVVERDVPVVALEVVDVAGGGLPLAAADRGERVLHVAREAVREREVELVAVPVAVRAVRVSGFGAAGDVQRAATGRLQRFGPLNGGQVDL